MNTEEEVQKQEEENANPAEQSIPEEKKCSCEGGDSCSNCATSVPTAQTEAPEEEKESE